MKKGDTIQGRTLYKEGHYLRKYGTCWHLSTFIHTEKWKEIVILEK